MLNAPLVDNENVRDQVNTVIDSYLARARAHAGEHLGPETEELFDAMALLLAGGKRLRAAFTYWSWRAHGGQLGTPGHEAAIAVGAALELFQAAALFHDDLMDNSDTRRGNETAHIRFARVHGERNWLGDRNQFGISAALLLGDLSLSGSEQVFSQGMELLPSAIAATTRAIFDEMRTEVTLGQYLDVLSQMRPWQDSADAEQSARTVIRAKSARYSVEHPLSLGAAIAGAGTQALTQCRGFGLPLGEAFQLRDDVLGVFGDPEETGKPAGDDLREGKRTVLLARTLAGSGAKETQLIQAHVGKPDLTDQQVAQLRQVIVDSGALGSLEELIEELTNRALSRIDQADLTDVGRQMLRELGLAAVRRVA